jgi:hypothetical protein
LAEVAPRAERPPEPAPEPPPASDQGPRLGVLLGVAALAAIAVVACAGGGLWWSSQRAAEAELAVAAPPPAPEADPPAAVAVEAGSPNTAVLAEEAPAAPPDEADDIADLADPRDLAAEPEPEPEPSVAEPVEAAAAAPSPRPAPEPAGRTPEPSARSAERPAPSPRPEPAPRSASVDRSASADRSAPVDRSGSADRSRSGEPGSPADPSADIGAEALDLDRLSRSAAKGALGPSDIMALETVGARDEDFTRSRTLLATDARKKRNPKAEKRYLDELLSLPENAYNPAVLIDMGRYELNHKSYAKALERANMAERHWQRLPPEVIAERKAQIYELQAKASRGLLNNTDDEARQRELVEQSLRFWRRYAQQVNSDTSLVEKANAEIASLEDIRRRLE